MSGSGMPLDDRITGAIIDSVVIHKNNPAAALSHVRTTRALPAEVRVAHPEGLIVLTFRHRGTDDDSGYLIVEKDAIHFGDDLA